MIDQLCLYTDLVYTVTHVVHKGLWATVIIRMTFELGVLMLLFGHIGNLIRMPYFPYFFLILIFHRADKFSSIFKTDG